MTMVIDNSVATFENNQNILKVYTPIDNIDYFMI